MIGAASRDTTTREARGLLLELHGQAQDVLIVGSLLVLALTGLPQKFDSLELSQWIMNSVGGIETLRLIHRTAAGVLIFAGFYHVASVLVAVLVWKVLTPLQMIPDAKDFRDALQMIQHFLGLRRNRVAFDRPSYFQKADYWIIVWSLAMMGASGLIALFPVRAARLVSGEAVQAALRLHSDSAILVVAWVLVVHLIYDTVDSMGANSVNTVLESVAPMIEAISGGRAHLRILSNLADRRLARASCAIPPHRLRSEKYGGEQVRDGIVEAWAFAAADPYRAATHNKGIMNGIDAVVIATGNDWRAVEAGAHAFAARSGRYQPLSRWSTDDRGQLVGELELPMAIGTVGGATRSHPVAQVCLALMQVQTARELAGIVAAVGLAQNLAALRALATEGIQRGHMGLHARQLTRVEGTRHE